MNTNQGGITIQIHKGVKSFENTNVLTDINLTIKQGEFVAIVGRSGCGKSTLLRLIAGLEEPTDGEFLIDNEVIKGTHSDLRVLFQEARLLPWNKVLDNVMVGVKSGDKDFALKALKSVRLEEKANEWPSVLSGGQRQRVALARALVGNPKLLLLDEPLGALDALTRLEMQQLIELLWLKQKFTALLVTHDVSEAVALANRVILIESGKIAMDIKIPLSRPREKDNNFLNLEKKILSRLLINDKRDLNVDKDLVM